MRAFIFLLCCLLPLPCAAGTSEIDQFLTSRHLVAQVFYAKHATELSAAAKQQISDIVGKLQEYQNQEMLIRVEGFASPEGDDQYNTQLSLLRALGVADYLLSKHDLNASVFLTGFGEIAQGTDKITQTRRVDIAVYIKNRAAEALFDGNGKIERYLLR